MILAPHDAALFYRAWGALLTWVNDRRNIVPRFQRPGPERALEPALAMQIRKVIWAEDGLREQFLAEGAAELAQAERDLIASWADRVSGSFTILRHLQKHTLFMSKQVYGVVGIYSPLAEMFPYVPMFVEAVLLPFRDVIITDGLIQSSGIHISFGAGARRMFHEEYREKAKSGVRTSLGSPAKADHLQFSIGVWPVTAPAKPTTSPAKPTTSPAKRTTSPAKRTTSPAKPTTSPVKRTAGKPPTAAETRTTAAGKPTTPAKPRSTQRAKRAPPR